MVKFKAQVVTDEPEGSGINLTYKTLGSFDQKHEAVERILDYSRFVTYERYRVVSGRGGGKEIHVEGDGVECMRWLDSAYPEDALRVQTPQARVRSAVEKEMATIKDEGVQGMWYRADLRPDSKNLHDWSVLDGLGPHTVLFQLPAPGDFVRRTNMVTMTDLIPESSLGKEKCEFWVPGEWIKDGRGCVNLGSVSHFFKRGEVWELFDE